jgi:hypothetical protein
MEGSNALSDGRDYMLSRDIPCRRYSPHLVRYSGPKGVFNKILQICPCVARAYHLNDKYHLNDNKFTDSNFYSKLHLNSYIFIVIITFRHTLFGAPKNTLPEPLSDKNHVPLSQA